VNELDRLLANLDPDIVPGEFVFTHGEPGGPRPDDRDVRAMVREEEGPTWVIERSVADALGLGYDYVAAWVTLRVHSELAAVGLTATISARLAEASLSCNVIAGRFHDHLFVPFDRQAEVLELLDELARQNR